MFIFVARKTDARVQTVSENFMKTTISLLIFIFSVFHINAQQIEISILRGDEKFPTFKIQDVYPGAYAIVNDTIINITESNANGSWLINCNPSIIKDDSISIKYIFDYSVIIINHKPDTKIILPTFIEISDYLTIKDRWYKKDDYRYYKKIYKSPMIEYNSDSSYYCVGKYKGLNYKSPYDFSFTFYENGEWKCYNNEGKLVSEYGFKKGRLNGNYRLETKSIKINGQHLEGKMIGEWVFEIDGIKSIWTFYNDYVIFDYKKNIR